MTEEAYTPIEEYGVVGNLETCALVGPNGSIDWFPFPHLESPSILAAILDAERGGRFQVSPAAAFESSQEYVDQTNVLVTTFETDGGTATVTDFLPPAGEVDHPKRVLYRKVSCLDGRLALDVEYDPAFDYGRGETTVTERANGIHAAGENEQTFLESPVDLDARGGRAVGSISMAAGESSWFMLRCTGATDASTDPEAALQETVEYWREWVHGCEDECPFPGEWHDLVVRSALALKLLTHAETGAVAAAPTTSLPETIGGVRNWDYRYNWLRDAGFSLQALMNLGHVDEAEEYFEWLLDLCDVGHPEEIRPLYGLHGRANIDEQELSHLSGYRDSSPVRVGNEAVEQTQLDTYGEMLLAVDDMHCAGRHLDPDEWTLVEDIVDHVVEVWDTPDAGIWEVRSGSEHFVFSKLMCWVALDRAIAIATEMGYDSPVERWRDCRQRVRADILENGYDREMESFTQFYGSETVDATALLVPVVGFLPFDDHRVRETVDTIESRLVADEVLVRRYDGDDGLPGEEGAFVICSCWLVNTLALSGRVEEARERFDALTAYLGPLNLVAEEIDTGTGQHLGNFPQGFSHIGLINSALYLGFAEGGARTEPKPMGVRLGDPVVTW